MVGRKGNMKLITRAKEIAEKAHKGQVRKMGEDKGKPYIIHPERMAAKFTEELLVATAILHDVIEDTPVTAEDLLEQGIPEVVVSAVQALSRGKDETYLDFLKRTLQNPMARAVKREDLLDNLESIPEGSLKDKYRLALYILDNT